MKQAVKRWVGIFLTVVVMAGFAFPLSASAAESENSLTFYVMSDIHIYDAMTMVRCCHPSIRVLAPENILTFPEECRSGSNRSNWMISGAWYGIFTRYF